MSSDRMFKTALWGVEEDEVLEYMDRLLAVIERQQARGEGARQSREGNREFLIRQLRKDLSAEFQRHKHMRRRRYVMMAVCPLFCMVLVAAFCWFRIGAATVTGDSMSPALKPGDLVVYSRETEEYSRGDLVVCDVEGIRIIKRVAGIPGDIVKQDENGKVRILNGLNEWKANGQSGAQEIFLNKDEYFLLGDNRDMSVDSRDERIGPVQSEKILGRAQLVVRRIAGKL